MSAALDIAPITCFCTHAEWDSLTLSEKQKYDMVVLTDDNSIYANTGSNYEKIAYNEADPVEAEKPKKMYPVICFNCGGSFEGNKCKWCDTVYSTTKWG